MGDFFIHRNRYMSERDTRKFVNYSIEQGYETLYDVPDEVGDKICDASNKEFDKYDDTPDFYTMEEIESAIKRAYYHNSVNWEPDEIFKLIQDEL